MWYKKNLRIAQSIDDLATQNYNKPNQPFKWLEPVDEDGVLFITLSNESMNELRKIYKNIAQPLRIIYTFYYEYLEPGKQLVANPEFQNIPQGLNPSILRELEDYIIKNAKIVFGSDSNGKLISPQKIQSDLDLKGFVIAPAQEKDDQSLNTNIDFSKIIKPILSNPQVAPQVAPPGTGIGRSGIGISMLGLDNISVSPQELRLRQPILPETKIMTGLGLDLVKYQKYNFPINVESLAKSTYRFKAPVEIYIDGVLKIKGHPNQSLYPLYSENMPLSEGIHTLQAKDPKFNTTNTKIMNTQTFTFEVKENQPIKIIKEDPRPGSF
jgi:hypothetical protein